MKNLRFMPVLFLLCICASCEENDLKLPPGTKPDMLIGKWGGSVAGDTYVFTNKGGTITFWDYGKEEYITSSFTDWSYDGIESLYLQYKRKNEIQQWSWAVQDITQDSVKLRGQKCYRLY